MLSDDRDRLALGSSLRSDVNFDDVLERIQIIAVLIIDLFCEGSCLLQCLAVDADAVDHSLGSVVHACDDIVLTRIVHLLEDVDNAVDIDRDSVAARLYVLNDLVDDIAVHEQLADLLHVAVNNVGACGCDPEVRLNEAADERCQTADLSARAETEIIACCLIFLDLFDVFGRKLYFCLIEIKSTIKIACKYFFHAFYPFLFGHALRMHSFGCTCCTAFMIPCNCIHLTDVFANSTIFLKRTRSFCVN